MDPVFIKSMDSYPDHVLIVICTSHGDKVVSCPQCKCYILPWCASLHLLCVSWSNLMVKCSYYSMCCLRGKVIEKRLTGKLEITS